MNRNVPRAFAEEATTTEQHGSIGVRSSGWVFIADVWNAFHDKATISLPDACHAKSAENYQ